MRIAFAFAALYCLLVGCAAEEMEQPQSSADGQAIFDRLHCGVCHAVSPEGESPRGPNSGPNLWGVAWERSDEWVRGHIQNPRSSSPVTTMPDFPLEEDELDALVTWLQSLH
ncbi:MAG: cytochrome c [Planctomycetota bacterium]